ncbi:hypothetical protein KSS87_010558 [Heliosperma pusillum]|nr:hypothetical protein KSS87_010558 [Heliosperma pusillum]
MASDDIMSLHVSRNSTDLGGNNFCDNSGANDIGNVLGKEGPNAQPSMQELAESVSISESEEGTSQCFRNGDDSADINGSVERNQVGIHEKLGVKRLQEENNNNESSVRVVFNSLPSRSKRKLEELLSNWSDWHAKQCTSADSFLMDVYVSKRQRKKSMSLNHKCSPLYDRAFAVGLVSDAVATEERLLRQLSGSHVREAPRCFNCGSYNHPLSGCIKPVNKAAVNSARKDFQSKRNQNSNPRLLTRYYQDSPGGKFDGLIPGALSAETRKLLGLGALDPPPWLNRMRELGYPPGYLDPEEENQPSGITIFGDGEAQNIDVRNDPALDLHKFAKQSLRALPEIHGVNFEREIITKEVNNEFLDNSIGRLGSLKPGGGYGMGVSLPALLTLF